MDVEETPFEMPDLSSPPPMMPWRDFANWIRMGDRHDVVWGWIRNGYIPSQKYSKHMMVNLTALNSQLLEKGERM
ncbi:DNA-binding protein [Pseudomonas aeruginosa]|uniref:DNA-binding protein n=1 Tax=Pseudomonas aeruginosa TaxID=287 RepID=UPI00375FB77A|nr:DNA-binding protein [Pseudomonas aeruginosa]HCF5587789.1 DNA-binding protein [Pseudomonas aeruginosa]HCL3641306.1 DNA-binding protein [Pseudomonas aeruginosa]HCT2658415.1 DNA-binding protein [Pseudomonas aeruginosa]